MTDYATRDDVKKRMSGDGITMSTAFDGVIADKITEVSADIDRMVKQARGISGAWSFVADASASERTFYSRGGLILPIDDCIAITGVVIGTEPALVRGTDYLPEPMNGSPYVGLRLLNRNWPDAMLVFVTAKWGYALSTPPDVREATIIEVIRSYLGDRSGNDDRIGLTPFGTIVTAKAYTSKVSKLVNDYSMGGGFLRG